MASSLLIPWAQNILMQSLSTLPYFILIWYLAKNFGVDKNQDNLAFDIPQNVNKLQIISDQNLGKKSSASADNYSCSWKKV